MSNSHLDDELEQTITQQEKEILELNAQSIRFRDRLMSIYRENGIDSPELHEPFEQSLSAHDLIKRNEVISFAADSIEESGYTYTCYQDIVEAVRKLMV